MFANGDRSTQKLRAQRQKQYDAIAALSDRERRIYDAFDGRGVSWWEDGTEKRVWLEYDLSGKKLMYRSSGFGMFSFKDHEIFSIAYDLARDIAEEEGISTPSIYKY